VHPSARLGDTASEPAVEPHRDHPSVDARFEIVDGGRNEVGTAHHRVVDGHLVASLRRRIGGRLQFDRRLSLVGDHVTDADRRRTWSAGS